MMRIVGELEPQYVVFENVPPLLKYRHRVDNDLRGLGYGAIWQTMAAEDVGAPHRRLRVWVLAVRGLAQWELLPRPSAQGDLFAPWVDAGAADALWPTATTDDHATMYAQGGEPLGHTARWPTPTVKGDHNRKGASATSGDGLATAAKAWPTPAAADGTGSRRPDGSKATIGLQTAASGDGVLNPAWVELLMGYPVGWTDPDDDAAGAHAWPSGRGEQQHDHEPPRLVPPKSVRNRGARLKALGNAVVPQCAEAALLRALSVAKG